MKGESPVSGHDFSHVEEDMLNKHQNVNDDIVKISLISNRCLASHYYVKNYTLHAVIYTTHLDHPMI